MIKTPSLLDLLKAGVHFGHQKSKWHPKMEPYIYAVRDGVHIFDLEKTVEELKKAMEFVAQTVAQGDKILFLGTKKQAKEIILHYAQVSEMPYVIEKWIGGAFTNFSKIAQSVKKLKDLEEKQNSGELKKYTKKEQQNFEKEVEKLKKMVGGLRQMDKLPKAIFIVDLSKEKTARCEARKKGIPIIAICDTNVNPIGIDYPIPANDDAIKSLEIIISSIAEAIKEGKKQITNDK